MNKTSGTICCSLAIFVFSASANASTLFVSAKSSCSGTCGTECGRSWVDACKGIQGAIDAASAGDEVWVAAGTYTPIKLRDGVKVYGGFAGAESNASQSDPEANKTYIDGGGTVRAVKGTDNGSDTVLRGFIIQNGMAKGTTSPGGGLYLERSSVRVVQCIFRNNTAGYAGGAVSILSGGSPLFTNCRFELNGAVAARATPLAGGAVYNQDGSPEFVNCLFYGNKAGEGGAILTQRGSVKLTNCTLADNEATIKKGGAIFDRKGKTTVRNCIVWNNKSKRSGTAEIFNDASTGRTMDIAHSNVKGGWQGVGNINTDPMFADATNGDFRLGSGSPCRDKGDNAAVPADTARLGWSGNAGQQLPSDLGMKGRVKGSAVDMGAFESD